MSIRLIARLDIKGPNLIKGIQFEGLRVVGDPAFYAKKYYEEGADELLYIDTVASLYGRNHLTDIVRRSASDVFIPMTVGGGVRSVEDAKELLRAGADKIAINTAAVERPELIREMASRFGSQCMVLSLEVRRIAGGWEVLTNNGRDPAGLDAIAWARQGTALGAGELLVTSVDRDGGKKGFDLELIAAIARVVSVPLICSGGMGAPEHFVEAVNHGADAVAMASVLHYNIHSLEEIREAAIAESMAVRRQ